MKKISAVTLLFCLVAAEGTVADDLAAGFANPPREARPHTWWHWMNGNISKEGITADLEAMKEIGLGGAQLFDIGYGIPRGKVNFASPEWFDCAKHAASEAKRLGLALVMNTASGWSCAGGPWNAISNGMKTVFSSEMAVKGPSKFKGKLPRPPPSYNRDIAVMAVPTSAAGACLPVTNLWVKMFSSRKACPGGKYGGRDPQYGLVDPAREIDLTDRLSADGTLEWEVPEGEWTVLRIGYYATGRGNYPPSDFGRGLECDKLSATAQDAHWAGFLDKLLAHMGPDLVGRKNGGVTGILVDSYEAGWQNWTDGFDAEFERRVGYSIKPWLPVLAGRTVKSKELTERFLEDFRRAVSSTFIDNFGYATRRKARERDLEFYLEPYGGEPAIDIEYAHCADIPMTEFWTGKVGPWIGDPTPAFSEAIVWGRQTVAAESYTTWPKDDRWTLHPRAIKRQTDYMYCTGINRIIYHTYAHQPWVDPRLWPGMTMGRFGIMFNRNVTWWKMGKEWIDYQTRCQHLLRQGKVVIDAFYFAGEDAPGSFRVAGRRTFGQGSQYALLSRPALLAAKVEDGCIVSPGGARARFLVLAEFVDSASPEVMRKIESFAAAGVTVIGRMPQRAFGLKDFPKSDDEVRSIAARLAKRGNVHGLPAAEAVRKAGLLPDFESPKSPFCAFIHRTADDGSEIYFVAAQNDADATAECRFRVTGRTPEIWNPATGSIELARRWKDDGKITRVTLDFDPDGSRFVLFRPKPTAGATVPPQVEPISTASVEGAWQLSFPAGSGAPGSIMLDKLVSWTERPEEEIRYFSGTAAYRKRIAAVERKPDERIVLDLGDVRELCEVTVNGKVFPVLWKRPYRVDITDAAGNGVIELDVRVTNVGANRLIGDEFKPDDCTWVDDKRWNGTHIAGWPAWMANGTTRTSGRRTFTTWHHWSKDEQPLPSGLLGPVNLVVQKERRIAEASAKRQEGQFVLAERGWYPTTVIAVDADAAPSVQYAAEELRDHVKKITGEELPIVKDGDRSCRRDPVVSIGLSGDASLGDDGFEISSTKDSLSVKGGKRGVIYGVYELLERYGGVMWLSPDDTRIPEADAFAVPVGLSLRDKPAFLSRHLSTYNWLKHIKFGVRLRLTEAKVPENMGGSIPEFDRVLGKCHTFLNLVSPDKYYDTHPEYFSLVKGERMRRRAQLCLTNPDVFRIALSNVLARIEANKADPKTRRRGIRYYGISQDDWNNYCECERCAAIDAQEESHAGCVIWFVNKIAEAVEKKHPDVIIETLAYMYSRKPPKNLKPRDNVMICLCSIECDFSKPMAENRYKENIDFREDILKWRDIAKHLYIWDYAANWRATPVPYPNLSAYAENIRFYHESGVRYLYEEGFRSPSASFTDLKGWLGAKLMWNPYQPGEPLVRRFCEAYYGKARLSCWTSSSLWVSRRLTRRRRRSPTP